MGLQPRAVRRRHAAGVPGKGAERRSRRTAQPVTLPVIVNGRIDRPDDCGRVPLRGPRRRGDRRRGLRPPAGLARWIRVLKLTDAAGQQLALNDDHEDKGAGLTTHHADSWLRATLPADGTYYLHLGDVAAQGRPGVRLPPADQPAAARFRACASCRRASTPAPARRVPLTVYALRKDGFAGEIALALKDAPPGFTLQRRPGAGRPGPGAAHADRPADAPGESPSA